LLTLVFSGVLIPPMEPAAESPPAMIAAEAVIVSGLGLNSGAASGLPVSWEAEVCWLNVSCAKAFGLHIIKRTASKSLSDRSDLRKSDGKDNCCCDGKNPSNRCNFIAAPPLLQVTNHPIFTWRFVVSALFTPPLGKTPSDILS
jgi:hypothetical protein